jgi:DNA-binding Lrp family transcriptional regulator
MTSRIDELDGRILHLFSTEPRVGVLEASRRLKVARGTVQARLDRLERDGVVTSWAPRISPEALGYGVTAFVTLEIVQHEGRAEISARLAGIPEVLECWTVTGSGDLWCRIVAHTNTDLQRVIDAMVTDPAVVRSVTLIGLAELIAYRTEPLVRQSAHPRVVGGGGGAGAPPPRPPPPGGGGGGPPPPPPPPHNSAEW